MKTSHKMFLRRDNKRGHEDVLVVIDWDNVSDEDMKLMASHYVINCAARDLKGWDTQLPQSIEYQAAKFVHNEPLVKMPEAPESWKTPYDEKVSKRINRAKAYTSFKDAVKDLTPAEIRILLQG